ncbi:transcriptional regulator [Vibrio parahaemolyticus]|uniref:transcriptional regulator n=1 Tax=Vibrio parahaemolyticus TaxID=670 RepID=UPI0011210813|nr:transcriptional regulator [Vibrio parahaemolyticus]TOM30248.1 transcriptional regulator [Vibrio parahaemolyticus]
MKIFETEMDASERLGPFYIPVWENSDNSVANAIRIFREKWHSYSEESRSHYIINLIKQVIDPVVSEYLSSLPNQYLSFCPISREKCNYSELIKLRGFRYTADQIHFYLRDFVGKSSHTEQDILFISTQDMLKSLFMICEGKKPNRSKLAPDISLKSDKKTRLCALCGSPTEFSQFMHTWTKHGYIERENNDRDNDEKDGKKKRPDLSTNYCLNHRPKLHDGSWNSLYKQARRSAEQFEQEVLRLRRQIAHPDRHNAKSGDRLIDEYFYHFMLDSSLDPTNVPELRNLARKMVDSRLTDNKKRMLVLRKQNKSNENIGILLGKITGKPLSNQAVSKAIKSIREEFLLSGSKT